MAKITRFVVMVGEGPYASLKPYSALRYAWSARRRGLETTLIFYGDGLFCAKRGVGRESRTVGDFEAKVRELIENGIRVQVCQAPMRLYALAPEDLIEGVEVAEDVIGHCLDEETCVIWL